MTGLTRQGAGKVRGKVRGVTERTELQCPGTAPGVCSPAVVPRGSGTPGPGHRLCAGEAGDLGDALLLRAA